MGNAPGMFNFERLTAWERAAELADLIYKLTREFPPDERFGLTSQMRRSAVSISSNIAEGCSRRTPEDQARFWEFASGSVFEVVSQALLAHRQGFIKDPDLQLLRSLAKEQSKMLSGLRKAGKLRVEG